jgi:hypothetical protein
MIKKSSKIYIASIVIFIVLTLIACSIKNEKKEDMNIINIMI